MSDIAWNIGPNGQKVVPPTGYVSLRLVPVEPFTGVCEHGDCANPDHLGWGIADAVPAWSDCNRAAGRIYRVDDIERRQPGDTVEILVRESDVPWFLRRFGETAAESADGGTPQ